MLLDQMILDKNSSLNNFKYLGGKAGNLCLMESQGIPIPTWCCLSSALYQEVYHNLKIQIDEKLQSLNIEDLSELNKVQYEIESLFLKYEFNKELLNQIKSYFKEEDFLAIRSSATSEDGQDHSFAGQLSSSLYIPVHEIELEIKKCWASAFSARIIQYLTINKMNFEQLQVAVIVQKMVNSVKSGVLFSINPLMSEHFLDEAVITAGYGVGEGIVSDQVETDTYLFNRRTKVVTQKKFNTKNSQLIKGPNGHVIKVDVPAELRKKSVLTHKEISELVGLSTILYRFYGHDIDLEWAFDSDNRVMITQARPITTLGFKKGRTEYVFDNSNIVESFPGINTPWTISIIKDVYSEVFTNAVKRIGIFEKDIKLNKVCIDQLIGFYKGRAFYNLTHWYQMMRLVPFTESYIQVWEKMLGINYKKSKRKNSFLKNSFKKSVLFFSVMSKTFYYFIRLDSMLGNLDKKLRKDFNNFWKEEKEGRFLAFTPKEMILEIEHFKTTVFKDWELTLLNDIYAFIFTAMSKRILKSLPIEDPELFFNELMCGVSGMDSVAPVKSIASLSMIVKNNHILKDKIKAIVENKSINIKVLVESEDELNFRKLFKYHIDEFGDRGIEELKLESITFREDPTLLLKMILEYADSNLDRILNDKDKIKRINAHKKLSTLLRTRPLRKVLFPYLLSMSKRSINYRENFRLHRARGYGVVRRLSNLLGKKLVKARNLEKKSDIYFTDFDQVKNFTNSLSLENSLKPAVKMNKNFFFSFQNDEVDDRYLYDGVDYKALRDDLDKTLDKDQLSGEPCSSGTIRGEVLVVKDINEFNKNTESALNKILVAQMTDPGWVFLMTISKGLIVEKGSILSHTAIIGRELGIPTIVGVKKATSKLKSGDHIEMNGDTGLIKIIGEFNE